MGFATIESGHGLSAADRRRAARAGPSGVLTRTSYERLLASAGFERVVRIDLTAEYATTLSAWIDATRLHQQAIRAAVGDDEYERRDRERHASLAAIESGLLARARYVAERPITDRG